MEQVERSRQPFHWQRDAQLLPKDRQMAISYWQGPGAKVGGPRRRIALAAGTQQHISVLVIEPGHRSDKAAYIPPDTGLLTDGCRIVDADTHHLTFP